MHVVDLWNRTNLFYGSTASMFAFDINWQDGQGAAIVRRAVLVFHRFWATDLHSGFEGVATSINAIKRRFCDDFIHDVSRLNDSIQLAAAGKR